MDKETYERNKEAYERLREINKLPRIDTSHLKAMIKLFKVVGKIKQKGDK